MNPPFDPLLQRSLESLHEAARGDEARWLARTNTTDASSNASGGGPLVRLGDFYLATSPADGRTLYLLARITRAKTIVEFGASFGVSTLYLGAAAREIGGHVTTTEVHPAKCAALRDTFETSGLRDHVTLLEGDARETLADLEGDVDLLFLDGWKSMYLPILELLTPRLKPGALVVADNWAHEAATDYREHVTTHPKWFTEVVGELSLSYAL